MTILYHIVLLIYMLVYIPGFMTLQVTVDFWEISLRASSKEVITLHYTCTCTCTDKV